MLTIYFLVFCSVNIDNGLISRTLSRSFCATLCVDLCICIKPLTHNWTGVIFISFCANGSTVVARGKYS